jgi:hypothetical protein
MRLFVLTAALMAFTVLASYALLIVMFGSSVGDRTLAPESALSPSVKFVPPLEYLESRSRERTMSSTATGATTPTQGFHTKAAPPKVHVFQTAYRGGTQIVFDHEKHVKDLGLECIDCHHVERCGKCHLSDNNVMTVTRGKQALHENCIVCHANTSGPQKCDECHRQ